MLKIMANSITAYNNLLMLTESLKKEIPQTLQANFEEVYYFKRNGFEIDERIKKLIEILK